MGHSAPVDETDACDPDNDTRPEHQGEVPTDAPSKLASPIFPDLSPAVKKEPEVGDAGETKDKGKIADLPPEAPSERSPEIVHTDENTQDTAQPGGSKRECRCSHSLLLD